MPTKVKIWYRRDRKKWYGLYRVHGVRHAKSFSTRREAQLWRSYMSHKLNHEGWQGVNSLTWRDLTATYMLHKDAQGIANKTRVEIVNSLSMFASHVGAIASTAWTQSQVEDFVRHRSKHVTARTVNKDLESLRALYRWAVRNHYVNQGIEFHMLKTKTKVFRPPAMEKLADLFRRARQYPPLYGRMVLAVATGLRRSAIERIGLSERDEDYIDCDSGELITTESKGKQQIVKPLGPNVMAIVLAYQAELPPGTRTMFCQPWDGKVRFTWERIRREAGLPKLTFHQLRNLSVSMLAASGESAAVLQKHTGHQSYKTTEGYVGVSDETTDRVTRTLDGILGELLG